MDAPLRYAVSNTPFGWVGILASEKGLVSITFPQPSVHEAIEKLGDIVSQATQSPEHFADLIGRLRAYFAGVPVIFPDRLDLSGATGGEKRFTLTPNRNEWRATPFQRQVWQATQLIPHGETRTYGWVAQQVGMPAAARAAGQALGKNPLPIIIPCHRVVASNGGLGGFSGGLAMKERLLRLEKEHSA